MMESAKALSIIRYLADGVDPATGETFAPGSPYQHPDTIRALFSAVQALEHDKQNHESHSCFPPHAGKTWDEQEDDLLCAGIGSGKNVGELAHDHGCTQEAVQSRLEKLGYLSLDSYRQVTQEMPSESLHPNSVFVFQKPRSIIETEANPV